MAGFSNEQRVELKELLVEQVDQLKTLIPTLDQIQGVVREEVATQIESNVRTIVREEVAHQIESSVRTIVREEVRNEVRAEVQSQLEPIHRKLDEHRTDAVDDVNLLNGTVQHHTTQLNRIEHTLDLKPLVRHT